MLATESRSRPLAMKTSPSGGREALTAPESARLGLLQPPTTRWDHFRDHPGAECPRWRSLLSQNPVAAGNASGDVAPPAHSPLPAIRWPRVKIGDLPRCSVSQGEERALDRRSPHARMAASHSVAIVRTPSVRRPGNPGRSVQPVRRSRCTAPGPMSRRRPGTGPRPHARAAGGRRAGARWRAAPPLDLRSLWVSALLNSSP
jgi:hypothetical protein